MNCHSRSDGNIGDYCDGELYRSIQLFKEHPNALQLVMYFDEVEVCNPLGPQSGVHKLGKSNHNKMCTNN